MKPRSVAIRFAHLAFAASVIVLAGCSGGGTATAPQPRGETDELATAPETVSPKAQRPADRTTVACTFGQLVGVVLNPEQRRVYGSVLIDAAPIRDGYRLTIGGPPHATVLAHLLLDQTGDIAFADPTCRRFVVTDNVIP